MIGAIGLSILSYYLVKRMFKGLNAKKFEPFIIIINSLWFCVSSVCLYIAYEELVTVRRKMR